VLTIALCIHRINHHTTDRRHGSKNAVLIMPSGWTASGRVHGSQRCKAKWTYWASASNGGRGQCAGGTLVKSRETDRENGYENRLPVLTTSNDLIFSHGGPHRYCANVSRERL